jgi:hypothetical protein
VTVVLLDYAVAQRGAIRIVSSLFFVADRPLSQRSMMMTRGRAGTSKGAGDRVWGGGGCMREAMQERAKSDCLVETNADRRALHRR